jgi:hypothetical protein
MVHRPGAVLENAKVHIAVAEEMFAVAGWSDIAARLAWISAAFHLIRINRRQACDAG